MCKTWLVSQGEESDKLKLDLLRSSIIFWTVLHETLRVCCDKIMLIHRCLMRRYTIDKRVYGVKLVQRRSLCLVNVHRLRFACNVITHTIAEQSSLLYWKRSGTFMRSIEFHSTWKREVPLEIFQRFSPRFPLFGKRRLSRGRKWHRNLVNYTNFYSKPFS